MAVIPDALLYVSKNLRILRLAWSIDNHRERVCMCSLAFFIAVIAFISWKNIDDGGYLWSDLKFTNSSPVPLS